MANSRINMRKSLMLLNNSSGNISSPYLDGIKGRMSSTFVKSLGVDSLNDSNSFFCSPGIEESMFGTPDSFLETTAMPDLLEEGYKNLDGLRIFDEFSSIYQVNKNPKQVFDMLEGYINVLSCTTEDSKTLLRNTTTSKQRLAGFNFLHNNLRAEMWTWQLAESLLKDLLNAELQDADGNFMDTDNIFEPVSSDHKIMEKFFSANNKVRRCQIVIDWLETINAEDFLSSYYDKVDLFTDKTSTMWENTLHAKKKSSKQNKAEGIQMDPDAPFRSNEKLLTLDVEDDERLVRHVFAFLRAGKVDEAQQLCVRCGQSWRAATLEGWKLSHDPNFYEQNDDQLDVLGNQNRDIWKAACWTMLQQDGFSAYEKAIYACMCGSLEFLLPVCENWHDALWAYLKVFVDVDLEQYLRLHSSTSDRRLVDLPASYWARSTNFSQLFKELEANQRDSVREQSQQFFHQIQKHLILNDFDAIINVFIEAMKNERIPPHHLRFMAHFILFMRSVDKIPASEPTNAIMDRYINHLIYKKNYNLAAMFCSTLPAGDQVIAFAQLISEVNEDKLRKTVLDCGKKAGLDIYSATKLVAEAALGELIDLVDMKSSSPVVFPSERMPKIDAIINKLDWLLIDEEQILDAVSQCNAQMRIFLVLKQYELFKKVFAKLPKDSVVKAMASINDPSNNIVREFICYRAYREAKDSFEDWFQHFHQAPKPPANPSSNSFAEEVAHEQKMKQYDKDMLRWKNVLKSLTELASDKIKEVLTFPGGFMVDLDSQVQETPSDNSRAQQLFRLRQLCIPESVALLQMILHEVKRYKEAIALADLVASEDHKLYTVFPKSELVMFLQKVQESSKIVLDMNQDSMGFPLA